MNTEQKASIIALANSSGIDTDDEGDIFGSTNGALLKFAEALLTDLGGAQLTTDLPPLPPHIEVGGEGWNLEDFQSWKTFTVEDMGQYARSAIAPYAERIRLLERAAGNTIRIGSRVYTAEQIDGRIRELMHDLDVADKLVANAGREIEAARIDGRTASDAVRDATWRNLLEAVVREFPRNMGRSNNGNAPGHCHSHPGIWDDDNGALAGKPCAWCIAWNGASQALAAAPSPQENTK